MTASLHETLLDDAGATAARALLVPHLRRLAGVYETASAEYRARNDARYSGLRLHATRSLGELVGMLVALSAIDGMYGEGYANTARRYGIEVWP